MAQGLLWHRHRGAHRLQHHTQLSLPAVCQTSAAATISRALGEQTTRRSAGLSAERRRLFCSRGFSVLSVCARCRGSYRCLKWRASTSSPLCQDNHCVIAGR
ncbi:hypothetical protein AB1Y20_002392 [Prymnesium parvum]|uniref:Uncharacterized protein n=1 Tax=Prymnesium parvum TaxID=97485 RepID=A0AB34JAZ6_PRYPA